MRIGCFTSIEDWGGSETYLKSLMLGLRERGHTPVLFGVAGSRLWNEARAAGIECVAWEGKGAGEGRVEGGGWKVGNGGAARRDGVRGDAGSGDSAGSEQWTVESGGQSVVGGRARRGLKWVPMWVRLLAGNVREMRRLECLFRRNPVDVVHVAVSGVEVAGLAARRVGIPAVAMNMITPPAEGYWLRRRLMRYTARRYAHVCSQSRFCTEAWARLADLPAASCSFVWNGADLCRYRPHSTRTPRTASAPFRLVSLGRLHPMKGYLFLMEAMRVLGDPAVTLRIVGEGIQRAELERQIAAAGLAAVITLPGFSEQPERELADADCFVLPSVSHESCPAVLAEAMACGLPLITSDFGPLAEVNVHGETGLVVPSGSAHALADAIARLRNDPHGCAAMGQAGLRRAQLFSRERMLDETLALYARVLLPQGI